MDLAIIDELKRLSINGTTISMLIAASIFQLSSFYFAFRFAPFRGDLSERQQIEFVEEKLSGKLDLGLNTKDDLHKIKIDQDYLENPSRYRETAKSYITAINALNRKIGLDILKSACAFAGVTVSVAAMAFAIFLTVFLSDSSLEPSMSTISSIIQIPISSVEAIYRSCVASIDPIPEFRLDSLAADIYGGLVNFVVLGLVFFPMKFIALKPKYAYTKGMLQNQIRMSDSELSAELKKISDARRNGKAERPWLQSN